MIYACFSVTEDKLIRLIQVVSQKKVNNRKKLLNATDLTKSEPLWLALHRAFRILERTLRTTVKQCNVNFDI